MNVSLAQAPWPWSLEQPSRAANAAPGSSLAGPLAEDPAPPAEGAADAPALGAPARPADLPAPQRVGAVAESRWQGGQGQGGSTQEQANGQAGGQAAPRGVNIYV